MATPYEKQFGLKPDISNFHIFSSHVYIKCEKEPGKLDSQAQEGHWIGLKSKSNGHILGEVYKRAKLSGFEVTLEKIQRKERSFVKKATTPKFLKLQCLLPHLKASKQEIKVPGLCKSK